MYMLPITQFETAGYEKKEIGFQLVEMKDLFNPRPSSKQNPFQPHQINFYALLILIEGEMNHEVDFVEYRMVKGDCLFICKEQIHKFDKSGNYDGYGIIFTEEFVLKHFSTSAFSKISFLSNFHLNPSLFKNFGDIRIFIRTLKREFSLELGNVKNDIVASILAVFLLKAQLHTSHVLKSYNGDYSTFFKFKNLVSSNYAQTRKASEYANFLNTTYTQ